MPYTEPSSSRRDASSSESHRARRLVHATAVLGLILASTFWWSGTAPASDPAPPPPPSITSFVATPNPVTVPGSTQLNVTVDRALGPSQAIRIINENTGATVVTCEPYTYSPRTTCSASVSTTWAMNKNPQPIPFRAEVVGESSVAHTTVEVRRYEFQMDLQAIGSPVTVPGSAQVKATVNRSINDTPYNIEIINSDTGQSLGTCTKSGTSPTTTCTKSVSTNWAMNKNPQPMHFSAVLRSPDDVVSNTAHTTVEVEPFYFSVGLSFESPTTLSDGTLQWRATAIASRSLYMTPYSLKIERLDGSVVASCSSGTSCSGTLGAGTYRATVDDWAGDSFGQSSWWTLSSDGIRSETVDDLELVALAAAFPSVAALCEKVLLSPVRTHLMQPPSSLSDQYRACVAAAEAGKSVLATLALVAAAGGGTAILWDLGEEVTRDTTPSDPSDADPPENPPPAPPLLNWSGNLEAEVDQLLLQNPQLETRERARTVLKQCKLLVRRAALAEEECLQLPIFVSGDLDVPEPTRHDRESILRRPQWVKLNYERGTDKPGRGWQNYHPNCPDPRPPGIQCHEYPFFASRQGGLVSPRPRVKPLNDNQNVAQGRAYGGFSNTCLRYMEGATFLSVPAPAGSGLPTLKLCNRPSG